MNNRRHAVRVAIVGALIAAAHEPLCAQTSGSFIRQPEKQVSEAVNASPRALAENQSPSTQAPFKPLIQPASTPIKTHSYVFDSLNVPTVGGTAAPSPRVQATRLQWVSRGNNSSNSDPSTSANEFPSLRGAYDRQSEQEQNHTGASRNGREDPSMQQLRDQASATHALVNEIATRVDSIQSKVDEANSVVQVDRTRAALVSARITNDPRFSSAPSRQENVERLESPQGWQAVGQRLSAHVAKCESLLRHRAFCSAREEAEMASLVLVRHIDLIDNLYRCEPAWQAANRALREAEDFLAVQRTSSSGDGLRDLIDSHDTPILKDRNLSDVSPLTAAQHYQVYAQMQLVEAMQGHPWASELLYTVGRTYQSEADVNAQSVDVLRMKALTYYRASCETMPTNAIALNQLGYLLLQMDRNAEAREALALSVSLKNDPATLSNLAEASRRLGDAQTVNWASSNIALLKSRQPQQPAIPPYVEVSPEEFISISPRGIGPKPSAGGSANGSTPVAPNSGNRTAAAPSAAPFR